MTLRSKLARLEKTLKGKQGISKITVKWRCYDDPPAPAPSEDRIIVIWGDNDEFEVRLEEAATDQSQDPIS